MYNDVVLRTKSGLGKTQGVRIDGFLDSATALKLYDRWKDEWGTPIMHRGGTTVITCEMVASVGYSELKKVYGVRAAKELLSVAETNQVTR
jgi:hypothetical protein